MMKVMGWAGVLLVACGPASLHAQAAADLVRQARAESNHAILTRKMPEYLRTITQDFVITSGSGKAMTRTEFLEVWREDFANPDWLGCLRTPEGIEVSESQPAAAEHGHFVCVSKQLDGTQYYTGTYLAMWRNEGGVWRTRSELYVTLGCAGSAACKPKG